MKIDDKVRDIIDMINDAIQYEDWDKVQNANTELEYLYEQISSTGFDDIWQDQ
jgi:hypothetical protein